MDIFMEVDICVNNILTTVMEIDMVSLLCSEMSNKDVLEGQRRVE